MQTSSNLLHIISNTMQITTATTPETAEVAVSHVNENNMPDVDQRQIPSNKQVSKTLDLSLELSLRCVLYSRRTHLSECFI